MNFDPRPYAETVLRQNKVEQELITERLKQARFEAKGIADRIMANDSNVRAVILFGSVAKGNPANADFDIDLALDGGDTYKAMDITLESSFPVDLVNIDLLPESMRLQVTNTGIRL